MTSPGRILPDLTIEQMIKGNSRVRNVAIGAAFQYMHIIEKWGTGIPRIYQDAKEYGLLDPELKDFGTSFRISIYRKVAETDVFGVIRPEINTTGVSENTTNNATDVTDNATDNATDSATNNATNIKLSKKELTLLRYISSHPTATQKESAEATGITIGTVKRLFPSLQKKAALKRNGNHKDGFWEVLIKIPD